MQIDASGGITKTGFACGGVLDFTFESNYGVITAATTTPIWAKSAIFASSTSYFVNANFINSTTTNATTTNLAVSNIASTSQLVVSSQASASGQNCLQIDPTGAITKTGTACGGTGATPGGNTGAVQFNNGGTFTGNDGLF